MVEAGSEQPPEPSPPLAKASAEADYPAVREVVPNRSAVQSFPYGTVFVFDHDLRYTHVGGEVLTSLGRDRTADVGRTLWDMFDGEAVRVREPAYRKALAGKNVVFDAPLDGDRVLEMHLSPLFDATGTVTAALGYSLDVTELRRETESLLNTQEQFCVAFEKAPIGMALATTDGTLYRVNTSLRSILHSDDNTLLGLALDALTADTTWPSPSLLPDVLAGQDSVERDVCWRRPRDGGNVWVRVLCTIIRSAASHVPSLLLVQVTDITKQRQQHEQIMQAHAFQQAVLAVSPDVIHVRDVNATRPVWASKSLGAILGYTDQELTALGTAFYDHLVHPGDRARFDAASTAAQGVEDGVVVQVRHRARHADGRYVWLSRRLTPFTRDSTGAVTQVLGVSRDVTDTVALETRLEHASLHDDLTGLPNRRLVLDRLGGALQTDPFGDHIAVLFCDLDGFKAVNDTHGHAAGDRVLQRAADLLRDVTRNGDTVGRLGGDEFVVIVHTEQASELVPTVTALAARLCTGFTTPDHDDHHDHDDLPVMRRVTVSVGVALAGPNAEAEELLHRADQAMYLAKAGNDRRRPGT